MNRENKTRNIREVKVGDRIETDERYDLTSTFLTMRVEEVLQNCFGYQYFGKEGFYWMTFDELDEKLEDGVWKLKSMAFYEAGFDTTQKKVGVDDSEEVELDEMDINNILRALDYLKEHNSICNVWTTGQLIEKLNKMLRNK